jgi:sugar phosphate permease
VGVLNAITYIGSALSPYAIALLAGKGGWNKAVLLWSALAALSAVLCSAARKKWNDFKNA